MKSNHLPFKAVLSLLLLSSCFTTEALSQTVTRGAYLQVGNKTSIIIRWRTSAATNSRVRISGAGGSYDATGNYATQFNDATSVIDHSVTVSGLTADSKYYYSVGSSAAVLQVSANNFFTTAPLATTTRKIKITAFGDCGAENATNQAATFAAYETFLTNNSIEPDAFLLMGDNAYTTGTDPQYTSGFFTPYGGGTKNILRNHKLYPVPGNHDYANNSAIANRRLRNFPYYSNFTVPQSAECGGAASGKPNYYSFDIGNIHFLSLDSYGVEQTDGDSEMGTASGTTVMKNWITNDLNTVAASANPPKWIVAYWHHPPYTKGSHNSDSETDLINIRTNFITFLEQKGVDLIICGHSHAYERSYLLRNYTGNWASFVLGTNAVNSSTAKYDGTAGAAPYKYKSTDPANPVTSLNHGTVYVVSGNVGATTSSTTGFGSGSMPWASTTPGIFYFEVEDNRLDAKMITSAGATFDKFTIMKDVNKSATINIVLGQSATLNASWPSAAGTYVWTNTTGTNRSKVVTPGAIGTYTYTVADNNNGGLLDNFTVNVSATLPVTFTNFNVNKAGAGAVINWAVSDISSHSYFSVERSVDGISFTEIGKNTENINGQAAHSFTYNDLQLPSSPVLYYRIKQCDINGSCRYTDIKSIRVDIKDRGIVLYPQPAQDVVNIVYTASSTGKIRVSITDQYGKDVLAETRTAFAGRNDLPFAISTLKPGNYIITVNDGKSKRTEKLIKL